MGLAIGDALGAIVEYKRPGTFEKVSGFRTGGSHGLVLGEWTDETSMALALADSISSKGWDLKDQADRYLAWWRDGAYCVRQESRDINHVMAMTLDVFERTGDFAAMNQCVAHSTNNGSLSRLAPIVVAFHGDEIWVDRLSEKAADSSRLTHPHHECVSACRYLVIVLAGLVNGIDRDVVLSADWEPVSRLREIQTLHKNVELVIQGSFRVLQPPEIQASGYSAKCLEAALWSFHQASSFEEAVLAAVNLGYDADNAGAVCGQLAGAFFGERSIPAHWMMELARKDLLDQSVEKLLSVQRED